MGHWFGFGRPRTRSYRTLIYGTQERGLQGDPPHDSETGEGYVPERRGYYHDALTRGKIALIAEVFGGLTPHATRFLRQLSRVAAKHASRDSTKYTKCARSFCEYHGQRISHACAWKVCRG